MKAKMEPATVNHVASSVEQSSAKRPLTVKLSRLAVDALRGEVRDVSVETPVGLESAIRCYLADRDAGRPAWPYPDFLRGSEVREDIELELGIADDLWNLFEAEALRQQVSVQQLSEHAAFYFAAELNAGRLTQRILDDLAAAEVESEAS